MYPKPKAIKQIAVELAERTMSEIARNDKRNQVNLGAEPEAEQCHADRRQHAQGVGEECKPGDRREKQHACNIGSEEPIDEIAGEKASPGQKLLPAVVALPAAGLWIREPGRGEGKRGGPMTRQRTSAYRTNR